jgi:hypothetical protein
MNYNMEKTISKSFRLPQTDALWLQDMAKNTGITQTEIVSNCIASAKASEGKGIALNAFANGGVIEDNEGMKLLTQFGIATASGIAGYHIAGFIRKQLEMDEDKGAQLLIGMITGLGTLFLQAYHTNKE